MPESIGNTCKKIVLEDGGILRLAHNSVRTHRSGNTQAAALVTTLLRKMAQDFTDTATLSLQHDQTCRWGN